ncbi:type II toxin-antitoxin system PemK/MazF family toxin [Paenarthrobacter sp. PH39-S1]|uniref:type II toxin-antitoxin system PemK/MazF family toxin n=1 Tax=Paenarthrobacter sp. PH39-S1 TaxID=3046204 RepID=UPI0024BAEA5C|nr:type II toxin-antitoxin system PemK/MazF family toxin [Paenarthrobacter sp. PH39-S1]MDJ0356261.1 type II toxin-antitoxin system PemK/MazF family toxin [Paenarthrobacter sp. PH39-S1]
MSPNRKRPTLPLRRGVIYAATLSEEVGEKYWLVVSNNQRNQAFGNALAIRITTTVRSDRPSRVALPPENAVNGWALCDEVTTLYDDEPVAELSGVSMAAMANVNVGLMAALGIPLP